MSASRTDGDSRQFRYEIPIEPLPARPVVPRVPPPEEPDPVAVEVEEAAPSQAIEREEAGGGALRPSAPPPAIRSRTSAEAARSSDRRHPVRASFGLLVLVVVGSLALAGAVGVAIAFVAFAVRQAVS